jgi:Na+/H+ antiporter NhaD/arsenite permease-like protein
MLAIGLLIAINSIMFREGVPESNERSQRKLAQVEKHNTSVEAMEKTNFAINHHGFVKRMRNLSEKEGGIMEYTRRRHRYLGDYVHEDVSDKFSAFGKWSTAFIYFAFWVWLMFPNWFLLLGRPGIAMVGGLSMVVWRYILQSSGHGPYFDVEKVIIMEPLFLLFGLMLTTIYIEKMERGGLFDKLRNSLDDPVNWKRSAKIMVLSTLGSAAVMNDSIVLMFSGVVVDLCVRHKVSNSLPYLLSLATTANIGSALTMTGNPQNILIVSLAYDDISWIEFAGNMILPVTAASIINATMLLTFYATELFPGSSGLMENIGIVFSGNRTPEMLAQEHAYFARKAASEESSHGTKVFRGWSIWSMIQALVIPVFLIFFALGFDVGVVSIAAGATLMVVASCKRQYFDPKSTAVQYDHAGNALAPTKTYDMDENEVEPEDEELVFKSKTMLGNVNNGLKFENDIESEDEELAFTPKTTSTKVDNGLLVLGAILIVVASSNRQHFEPKPTTVHHDDDSSPLSPQKTQDMDGKEIKREEEHLVTESETTLTEVDYGLLILFIGQFILIGSFVDTGLPQAFFNLSMGGCADRMAEGACVYWFVFIVTILSNVASNVPVCQMLAATFPYATPYEWLQVSFSTTIAGNLTMLGSAANMIVAFQAAKVGDHTFTSKRHAPFGIPSTLVCLYVGTFLLATFHFAKECSEKLNECPGQEAA